MKRNKNDQESAKLWRKATQMIRGGTIRSEFGETSEAIFLNSGFAYDTAEIAESRFNGVAPGYVYSRYVNPNLKMLQDRLTLLEGAEDACVMASGMAAVFASMMCHLKAGDHVVANSVLFGSCYHIITKILPQYGIEYTLVDGGDLEAWEAAFKPNTTCVFIETPANPTLDLTDIEAVAEFTKDNEDILLIVDNIFATPLLQHPLDLGADVVVYSTTKHMDGQGRTIGGAVIGSAEYIQNKLLPFHRHTGPAMSPFTAWIILKSLETFILRVEKQCDNAMRLASFLENHENVKEVHYPGLISHHQHEIARRQMTLEGAVCGGAMLAFEVKGGKSGCFDFMNELKIIDISNNLGDSRSLITHPSTTTHSNISKEEQQEIGITDELVRLSVGLEDAEDLMDDLSQALDTSNSGNKLLKMFSWK